MWCLQETNYEHSNHILGGIFLQIHLLKASLRNLMPVATEHDYCSYCKVDGKWYGFNCRLFSLGIYWHPWILEVKSVICHGTKNIHKVKSSSSKPRGEIFVLCRVWQQLCSAAKKFPYTSCTEVMPAYFLGVEPSITSCLWELLKVKLKMTYWNGKCLLPTRRRIANGNTYARIKKIRLTNHGRS